MDRRIAGDNVNREGVRKGVKRKSEVNKGERRVRV